MISNNNQVLGVYDEMSIMYGQLDAYKHSSSRLDQSTLLELYNGGSWYRNFKNQEEESCKMYVTAFNMCGFIQPDFVVGMLNNTDPDAFNDRQFFVCPPEVEYKYDELKFIKYPLVPKVFQRIRKVHQEMMEYEFSEDGRAAFIIVHNELSDRKLGIPDDEDRRGTLSKAKGQVARLAMILHVLEVAIGDVNGVMQWDIVISKENVECSKIIIDYVIEQKFLLMPPEMKIQPVTAVSNSIISNISDNYLAKFLSFKNRIIQASDVSQFRLMPLTPLIPGSKNKYPVENVKQFMGTIANAGFGLITEHTKPGSKRKCTVFEKNNFECLGDNQLQVLKKLRIDKYAYDCNIEPTQDLLSPQGSSDSMTNENISDSDCTYYSVHS